MMLYSSHVLKALGRSAQEASATLRFSFGPETDEVELKEAANKVLTLIPELQSK